MLGAGALAMGLAVGCVVAGGGSQDEESAIVGSIEETDDAAHELRRFCGGFAGLPCKEGEICVDYPKDDCDPERGGADCIGICIKERVGGERCGELVCPKGTHGCNCACGNAACVPEGMVCPAVCM